MGELDCADAGVVSFWVGIEDGDLEGEGERRTGCPVQQLVEQDLHGIEPEPDRRLGARRDALVVKTLAEVPQPDLVEVVQAQGLRALLPARRGLGYDLGDVNLEEPQVLYALHVGQVADLYHYQHDHRQEEHERREDREALPVAGRVAQVGFR